MGAELEMLPDCELIAEEATGTMLEDWGGGTGMTTVTEDEATALEAMLDPRLEGVGMTEL